MSDRFNKCIEKCARVSGIHAWMDGNCLSGCESLLCSNKGSERTSCARLTECRINGDKVDYIANSRDGNIKFIYHASLGTVESDLPCKLNHIVKVDHDPIHRDHKCIMECTKEYSGKCIPLNKECFEDSAQQCTKWCTSGSSEWSRGEPYSIANRMEFATDNQCSEYLDYL